MRKRMALVLCFLLASLGGWVYMRWDYLFEDNTPPIKTNTEVFDSNSNQELNSVNEPGGIPSANTEETEANTEDPDHQANSPNVEDPMTLLERRKEAIANGDRAEARRLAIEIAEKDGNGVAIRRYYLLAGKDHRWSIDQELEFDLDMDRIVKEQTPKSLSKILEDSPDSLQRAVVRRLKGVLDDEGRESWFDGLRKHSSSTVVHNAMHTDDLVYPALKEIEQARLSAFQALSDGNISDEEFVKGFIRGSTAYVGSVISPISIREDAATLLPSVLQDLEQLYQTHGENIGRRDCIVLHIGRCDGLHDFLANRTFSLQDKRNLEGSAYWCWISGIDGLVLRRSGVHSRSSSRLQDEPWLVAAGELRSAEVRLPVSSFQDAWDFVMPFFGIHGWRGSANKAILTPEFLAWLQSMCPAESKWSDGDRCDVMRFVSGRKPQSKILAKTIGSYLSSLLIDQPADDYVFKFISALFEAPAEPDWTPTEYDLFGNGQLIVNLWSEKEAKSKLFAELASMKFNNKAKEHLRSKAMSAALASTNEDWKKLLNWLLDEWE